VQNRRRGLYIWLGDEAKIDAALSTTSARPSEIGLIGVMDSGSREPPAKEDIPRPEYSASTHLLVDLTPLR